MAQRQEQRLAVLQCMWHILQEPWQAPAVGAHRGARPAQVTTASIRCAMRILSASPLHWSCQSVQHAAVNNLLAETAHKLKSMITMYWLQLRLIHVQGLMGKSQPVHNIDILTPCDVAGVKFEGSASDDSMDDAHMFGNQHAHRGVPPCASPFSIACSIMHNRHIKPALACIHNCPAGTSLACFQSEQLSLSISHLWPCFTNLKRMRCIIT